MLVKNVKLAELGGMKQEYLEDKISNMEMNNTIMSGMCRDTNLGYKNYNLCVGPHSIVDGWKN